jgi:exonuclease VII small subunit
MNDYEKTIKDLQDRVKSLELLLERVLFAWGMGRPLSEENDLYMDAHYYLKRFLEKVK